MCTRLGCRNATLREERKHPEAGLFVLSHFASTDLIYPATVSLSIMRRVPAKVLWTLKRNARVLIISVFTVHLPTPPPSPLPLPPSTYFCDTKSPSFKKGARSYCRFESVSHTMRDVKIARPIQIYTYAHGAGGREWGWCVC